MIELDDRTFRDALQAIARAMAKESDGKSLKRDLAKNLRGVVEPLRAKVIAKLMSLPSQGHPGAGMREAIARQTRAGVRFTGRQTGVNLVQRARGMPRNFQYAGRAFNREEGWNVTSLGGEQLVQQMQPAQWFDGPIEDDAPGEARRAITGALEDMADRIARDVHK